MITPTTTADNELVITFDKMSRGMDSVSQPTEIEPSHVPAGLQNVNVSGGYYHTIDGSTLHATGMVMPDSLPPKDLAYYVPSSGDPTYLGYAQNGRIYRWTGSAWVQVLVWSSSGGSTYGTHTQIGDYLIMANGVNQNMKWDGTTMIPLGAKSICTFESTESWSGGTAETTLLYEGVQSRKLTSTGANADMSLAGTWNFTAPLLLGRDYDTSDYIAFYVYFDSVTGLDTTNTSVYFATDGTFTNAYYAPASSWGTLAAGWNYVAILKSAFLTSGTPDWSTVGAILFRLDTTGSTINMIVDNCYMLYADVLPPCQYITNWKNMVIGGKTSTSGSSVVFSPVGAPDEFDPSAEIPIDENDGTDVTGLFPYYDMFLVFKDNSVHTLSVRLTGISYPEYVFGLKRVTGEHGASSHRAIVEANGKVFVYWRGQIRLFEGLTTNKISYRVDPTLLDFQPDRLYQTVACPYREQNKIYLWWTPSGETTNTQGIMYDYQERAFLPITDQVIGWAGTVFASGVEYPLTATYTGRILRQASGATLDGTDIETIIPLPWVSAGPPHAVVSWREVQIAYANGTGDLLVQYRIANHPREFDDAAWTTAGTIDMSVAGERGRVFLGERSRYLQLRVYADGDDVTLYWPVSVKGRVLGYIV